MPSVTRNTGVGAAGFSSLGGSAFFASAGGDGAPRWQPAARTTGEAAAPVRQAGASWRSRTLQPRYQH